ncbi:DNA-binding transcription factor yap1 [Microbotryomycetes sp. JL201]|nr:DNA-binding transcription factor yap1 [Microbotryomycetes sp. JL201]
MAAEFSFPDFLQQQPQDDYLAKLLSFDAQTQGGFPSAFTIQGASSPEDNTSSSASPESSADAAAPRTSSAVQRALDEHTNARPTSFDLPVMPQTAMAGSLNESHAASAGRAAAGGSAPGSHDKRKPQQGTAHAIKDARRTSDVQGTVPYHSHEHDDSNNNSGSDDLNSGGPSSGRKGTKNSEKRKAQNRQAQRNFRERKEKHMRELEDRVLQLEQKTTEQDTENSALKQLLEHLKTENERLKVFESAFSFSYDKDVSKSSTMPTANEFSASSAAAAPAAIISGLPTQPSPHRTLSSESSLTTAASSIAPSPGFTTSASLFGLPSVSSPATFELPAKQASVASGGALGATTDAYGLPQTTSPPQFDENMFLNSLVASPAGSAAGNGVADRSFSGSSASLPTPPDLSATNDLFSAYRDPNFGVPTLTSLNDFDSLFGSSLPVVPTSTVDDPLAAYLSSPSPPVVGSGGSPASQPAAGSHRSSQSPLVQSPNQSNTLPCGGKFEFDVDGLCSEMKLKATCQEAARQSLRAAMKEDADALTAKFANGNS